MSTYLTSQQFVRVAAVVFVTLVIVIAAIQRRPSEEAAVLTRLEPDDADALVRELARCRTVTSDDTIVLESCRRLWAENRQHFFASTRLQQLPVPQLPDAPVAAKSQERLPQLEVEQKGTR
jgi:conjugative transfer region protein TrbK